MFADLIWMLYFLLVVLIVSVANTIFIGALLYLVLKLAPKVHELIARVGKTEKKTN